MRSRQDVQGRQGKAGGNGDETQLLQFSTAKNVNRRHLTESQRAMYAAKVANLVHGTNQHKVDGPIGPSSPVITIQAAADMLNIGEASVRLHIRMRPWWPQGHPPRANGPTFVAAWRIAAGT